MTWTIAAGTDNGDPVIVSINEKFRDPAARAGLTTRISARFLGGYMLQSVSNRATFEDSVQPFLDRHGGVLVAGITRTKPVSYTFHFYCRSNEVDPHDMPVAETLKPVCTISVHHDPEWTEYDAWLPRKRGPWTRLSPRFGSQVWLF
jgi:hypothetical protein